MENWRARLLQLDFLIRHALGHSRADSPRLVLVLNPLLAQR